MKNGRILAIACLLIIMVVFGFSYYNKNAPTPEVPEKQKTSVNTASPTEDTASANPAAAIEQAKKNGESMWILFRSTTCAPCVEMQKIFDQLRPDYQDKVKFIAVDVNDRNNMELIKTWKIQYIPTTFIIDSTGKVSYQNVGIIPVENLKKELNRVVK